MKKYLTLVKTLCLTSFGFSGLSAKLRQEPLTAFKPLAIGGLMVIAFTPLLFIYLKILNLGYDLLAPGGLQGAILTLGLVLVTGLVFYFGIFYVINVFYYGENNEFFLALPVRAWQVLGARFTLVLLYEYLTALPLLAPPLLVFGLKSQASVFYWGYAILGYLLVPLVPLALASILVLGVMRFTNLTRRKDLFRVLGGIFVIVLAVGLQIALQKFSPDTLDPTYLQEVLTHPEGFIQVLSRHFPFLHWFVLALLHSTTVEAGLNFATYAVFSFFTVALCWYLGGKLYFPGLVGAGEVTRRKPKAAKNRSRLFKVSSRTKAYLQKEIRLLLRTPTYFMNCVLSIILIPLFMGVPFYLRMQTETEALPWAIGQNPQYTVLILAVLSGIAIFMAGTSSITSTTFSREGKYLFVSKYIPLPFAKQIQAKLLSGLLIASLGNLLLLSVAVFLFKLPFIIATLGFIVMFAAIIPMQGVGLLIDLYHPKLNWDQEQKAVKQNINALLTLLISVILAAGMFFALIKWLGHSLSLAVLFMLLYNGMLAYGLYQLLIRKGKVQYQKLEG